MQDTSMGLDHIGNNPANFFACLHFYILKRLHSAALNLQSSLSVAETEQGWIEGEFQRCVGTSNEGSGTGFSFPEKGNKAQTCITLKEIESKIQPAVKKLHLLPLLLLQWGAFPGI